VVDGFSKAQVYTINDALVGLRDGGWGNYAVFREMKIEFVGEKEDLTKKPDWLRSDRFLDRRPEGRPETLFPPKSTS
jgi:hypothetical protein